VIGTQTAAWRSGSVLGPYPGNRPGYPEVGGSKPLAANAFSFCFTAEWDHQVKGPVSFLLNYYKKNPIKNQSNPKKERSVCFWQ